MPLVVRGGKLLRASGKLSTDETCCCVTSDCPCPTQADSCDHVICFSFNIATQELSGGYYDAGYQMRLSLSGTRTEYGVAYIYDPGDGNYLAGFAASGAFVEVPMTLVQFFDNWHDISIIYRGRYDLVQVCAYGSIDTGGYTFGAGGIKDAVFVGSEAAFPGPVDVQIKNITMLSNPDTAEEDFIFPTDSFDSTIGSGQSIDGDIVHVVCSDGGTNGYLRNFSPTWDFDPPDSDCSCDLLPDENLTYFSNIAFSVRVHGHAPTGGVSPCDETFAFDETFTADTWTRTDYDFAGGLPTGTHFQLFHDSGIASGGADACNVYFCTPSGDTTVGISTESATITACTGGDSAGIGIGGSVIPSVSGTTISASLGITIACFSGVTLLCSYSQTVGGSTAFPSHWVAAPGTYTISGTDTTGGWDVNYSIVVTFS